VGCRSGYVLGGCGDGAAVAEMNNFPYKTKPFDHQRDTFLETREEEVYGLFWEMGTGKSKTTIDTAAHLRLTGKIDGMLIIAPNGVHRNWITDELPRHMPDQIADLMFSHYYQTSKANTKWHQSLCKEFLRHPDFKVLAMSYSAFMTKKGKEFAWAFMKPLDGRLLYVLDESARIKTPKAKRTRSIILSGKYARFRRILTGTPVANSPFDIYSQVRFLEPDFWKRLELPTFTIFKSYFGVFEENYNRKINQSYKKLLAYRNLQKLNGLIAGLSSRVTKDEVLDLPPKLYSKRYVELSSEQMDAYQRLKEEYLLLLDSGEEVTAILAVTRILRLQQIVNGYIGTDDGKIERIAGDNPRLKLLEDICEDIPHKAIIWGRFQEDITQICEILGETAVRYDGQVNDAGRAEAIEAFQNGEAKFFVGNPAAAGEGLTLHAARTVIYYSNSFKLTDRLQSEDRAHRIGQEHPVHYIDLVAEGTVDERIVKALINKLDVASMVVGDAFKEWIR
jgi:SNF2 family DNA or RNA helicase